MNYKYTNHTKKAHVLLMLVAYISFTVSVSAQNNNYHVYDDKYVNGIPSGIMGAWGGKSLIIDANCKENPYKGENCLKITSSGEETWCGVFIQQAGTWKAGLNAEIKQADLSDKTYLIFSARSDKDYEIAKLGMGEGGEASKAESKIKLKSSWQRFVMELPKEGLSNVNGLFLVVFEGAGTIYLDEIYYTDATFRLTADDVLFANRKEPLDPEAFYVYADKFENGIPTGFMGEKNGTSIKFDDNCKIQPYLGTKCIKMEVDKSESWRGLHIQYTGQWNVSLDDTKKLADLSPYRYLEFYARAEKNTDVYLIQEVGVGAGDDLEEKVSDVFLEVEKNWKRFRIDLKGIEKKRVNTLMYLVIPDGTLYLDEIRFVKK